MQLPGQPRNVCGERIKALRRSKGITQEGLAVKCQLAGWDVDRKLISKIEIGLREVTDYEILILAEHLKVEPDEIIAEIPLEKLHAVMQVRDLLASKSSKKKDTPRGSSRG